MHKILITLATLAALLVGVPSTATAGDDAEWVPDWHPCTYDGDRLIALEPRCVWDHLHLGGPVMDRSFKVTLSGDLVFIPHRKAHKLLFGC